MVIFTDRAHEEDDCLPMVIFTDRAHEEDDCLPTRGAVLIDPSSDLHLCFGGEIRQQEASQWHTRVVDRAEVLQVLVAKVACA